MIHLKTINRKDFPAEMAIHFPYNLPVIQLLATIEFAAPVTFLVGENGTGKSTLLEAIACAAGSIVVGSESVQTDTTLRPVRDFSKYLQLSWHKKTHKGFFLRAEDFFGYTKKLAQIRNGLEDDLRQVDRDYQGRSNYAQDLAKLPYAREIHELERSYGDGLHNASHGESFLTLFQSRFVPGGLYLLDEPEAPLSPLRQLGLIALLKEMVAQDAQFIIATHSPIIMAFPGAEIYSFDSTPIRKTAFDELEHVTLTRTFLNDPQSYLRHL